MATRFIPRPADRSPVSRVVPRVLTALCGLQLAYTTWAFDQPELARYTGSAVAFTAIYLGIHGFWFTRLRLVQALVAGFLAVSTLVLGVRGPPMWNALAVAALLALLAYFPADADR
jgi:hypothetical protein